MCGGEGAVEEGSRTYEVGVRQMVQASQGDTGTYALMLYRCRDSPICL